MSKLLLDLEKLGGIQYSCLANADGLVASTFPELLASNLSGASQVVNQIFSAVTGVGMDHREMIIELEENLLMAFQVTDELVLVLLTAKEVNMALINTSVRSMMPRFLSESQVKADVEPPLLNVAQAEVPLVSDLPLETRTSQPVPKPAENPALEAQLKGLMQQLQELLAEYIGPAASIVFDDAYDTWKAKHGVRMNKMAELLKGMAIEIEEKSDRTTFLQRSVVMVKAYTGKS
jgi:predicted regulator of Ras-like GTPase activity (Roadblock/LC7/MglB family)